jgi:uncharacterized protein (DUF58 family)
MKGFIKKRLEQWLSKRVPSNATHTLSSRNIFIMPTKFGFAYLLFIIVLFLLGTNYQNNTILLLSYLLASLFITVMMHSFYNFSQLIFSSTAKQHSFANQQASYPIHIRARKTHYNVNVQFVAYGESTSNVCIEQCELGESQVAIPYLSKKRGVYNLGRVKVYSEYPLGLFITWALLDFSHQLVVYPQAKKLKSVNNFLAGLDDVSKNNQNHRSSEQGTDDFAELKNYIVGESQARVAWKQLARGQGKLSKHYQSQQSSLLWLKLSDMPSTDLETKLSYLCFLIVDISQSNRDFGLLLDSVNASGQSPTKIEPSAGYQHQHNCLIALAKFKQSGAN